MSRPSEKTPKKKDAKKLAKKLLEMPDVKLFRKLFSPELMDEIDKRIGREKSKKRKKS